MRVFTFVCAILLAFGVVVKADEHAYCKFRAVGLSNAVGYATFQNSSAGILTVSLNVTGLLAGNYGLFVHQYGDQRNIATGSFGDIYDPTNAGSCDSSVGNLGQWTASASGVIEVETTKDGFLSGVNSFIGRGLAIHSTTNCATSTSADILATCVIGIANKTVNSASAGYTGTTAALCELESTGLDNTTVYGVFLYKNISNTFSVLAAVRNITGTRAVHIHTYGDLSTKNALGTGGHYNPFNANHSIPGSGLSRHVGDMGNLFFYNGGIAYYNYTFTDLLTLSGANNVLGRAQLVHQAFDNCTGPVGFAGGRYAQCVIGVANPSASIDLPAVAIPSAQNLTSCFASGPIPSEIENGALPLMPILNAVFALLSLTLLY